MRSALVALIAEPLYMSPESLSPGGHAMTTRSLAVFAVVGCVFIAMLSATFRHTRAQTLGQPEGFTAIAIVNNNLASGAGTVLINISWWSTAMERRV
jgi:hypothetical protein